MPTSFPLGDFLREALGGNEPRYGYMDPNNWQTPARSQGAFAAESGASAGPQRDDELATLLALQRMLNERNAVMGEGQFAQLNSGTSPLSRPLDVPGGDELSPLLRALLGGY